MRAQGTANGGELRRGVGPALPRPHEAVNHVACAVQLGVDSGVEEPSYVVSAVIGQGIVVRDVHVGGRQSGKVGRLGTANSF